MEVLNADSCYKLTYLKKLIVFILLLSATVATSWSQDVSGNWYGVGVVKRAGEESNYLSELNLVQTGNKVTGEFNYYFRSVQIKTTITGKYNSNTRYLEILASPVLNYQAKNSDGADCPMEGSFTLIVAKVQSTLTGWFNPTDDYKYTCRPIFVKFVKDISEHANLLPTFKPEPIDTVKKLPPPPPIVSAKEMEEKNRIRALTKRSFEPSPVFESEADSIKIDLYDNGEIDNDTVSLFINRKPVVMKQMLTDRAFTIELPVDSTITEVSMYADNLGKIPPNTAVAVVYINGERHEIFLTSTYIRNATMRFRKKPKAVNVNK